MAKGVYRIRNKLSGKSYVGSSRNIAQRWRQHRHTLNAGTSSCPRLQAAWTKYGADAFSFEIIEIVRDDQMRGAREQYWLDELGTFERGYNASPTVQVSEYMPRPPEWGRAISAAKLGKKITIRNKGPLSSAHRANIAAGLARHYEANAAKKRAPLTLEHRQKIGDGVRARFADAKREPFSDEHRARLSEAQSRAWGAGKYAKRKRRKASARA
jgi:group I intron endonuclease